MARNLKYMLALPLILSIFSCASTASIESNKNPAYNDVLTKFYIVVNLGDWKIMSPGVVDLADYLTKNLVMRFQKNGIETKASRVTGLEISNDQITKEIKAFGSDRVMEIQLTSGAASRAVYGNFLERGVFDVSIHDVLDNTLVWRAKITAETGFSGVAISADSIIESIISRLQADGLIAQMPIKSN